MRKAKGMEDYYPTDYKTKEKIIEVFNEVCKSHHYEFIETPVLEEVQTLTQKGSDEIREQIFIMQQRSNEELGLRFDMTVPATRLFLQKQQELVKPVRWSYADVNFRYENPQAGRLRSFYQLGCEIFGSKYVISDAENLNIIVETFTKLGLTDKDFKIRLNNRKFCEEVIKFIVGEELVSKVISVFDKYTKIEEKDFLVMLSELGLNEETCKKLYLVASTNGSIEEFKKLEEYCETDLAKEGLEELRTVSEFVDNKFLRFDMSIVRGLDYYTGIVYECFDEYGHFRALAGGGRYDNMIKQFGGQDTPATGFAIGQVTLKLLLEKLNKMPEIEDGVEYFISPFKQEIELVKYSLNIKKKMIEKGHKVNFDLSQAGMGKKFKYAEKIRARKIIIIGENELNKKTVPIKDMVSKEEEIFKFEEL